MAYFLLILILIICNEMRFCGTGAFNESYLDRRSTGAVNGIFVVLVLFSHYSQYAPLEGIYDESYIIFKTHMSQMVVATFLFYTGYGMMESVRKKGYEYIDTVPRKFIQLLIRFWIAVIMFLIMNAALGIDYPIKRRLLAFTLWDGVGNSNWYIFDILIMYIAIFISYRIGRRLSRGCSYRISNFLLVVTAVIFINILIAAGKDSWWYNTLFLLPAGFLYSENRGRIESVIMRSGLSYALTVLAVIGIYVVSLFHRNDSLLVYTAWAAAFMMLVLLFTMKVSIGNPVLEWLGQHVFSIYILQRIPMVILNRLGCVDSHKYISLIIVIAATVPMAIIFDSLTGRLFRRKAS